jgi:hypothetical protein
MDYNGVERTEDFYFNLSKPELLEMELGTTGGFSEMMNKIIAAKDTASLIKTFKELILKSYGVKSEDGKRFMKSKELSEAFSQTEAYVNLYMELSTNDQAASAFANGIIPKELAKAAIEQTARIENTDA